MNAELEKESMSISRKACFKSQTNAQKAILVARHDKLETQNDPTSNCEEPAEAKEMQILDKIFCTLIPVKDVFKTEEKSTTANEDSEDALKM